ncbi:zonular occludens toxin domain-containing protein [Sulfurimonas sp.]|uniref:zonular occludens toxin domain-containing protein n=1 Tax=Sulfurimonas sp. TaxID=2022749 RepID=UPI0025DE96D8|nr:zonular occludens toxin domain-containing protein [Sulfurimonas sp.]
MISFFVGVPGSGKTYYAVDKIFNNFSTDIEAKKDKKATYEICYTNINEFDFGKVENVYPLDFDDLKRKLTRLHQFYKDKKDDDFLIEKCKEYNIYNALFIVDEAHNKFDADDKVLIWWLSYHRHLFHEIILITQNLTLIRPKYKAFSEFFYKAFPQSLTLFKTHFKYNVYCNSRMALNAKSGSIKIKRNKKVFELYKSGDSINSQNVILKILGFAIGLFIILIFLFYFYSESLKSSNTPGQNDLNNTASAVPYPQNFQTQNVSSYAPANIQNNSSSFNYQSSKLLVLSCNSSSCYNEDITLPVPLINHFIENSDLDLLYTNNINSNYLKIYLSSSERFYKFLISNKGEKEDEKKSISNNLFSGISSPIPQSR